MCTVPVTLSNIRLGLRCGTHVHNIRSRQWGQTKLLRSLQPQRKAPQVHPGGDLYTPHSSVYAAARKATKHPPPRTRMNSAAMGTGITRAQAPMKLAPTVALATGPHHVPLLPVLIPTQVTNKQAQEKRPLLFGHKHPPTPACKPPL